MYLFKANKGHHYCQLTCHVMCNVDMHISLQFSVININNNLNHFKFCFIDK